MTAEFEPVGPVVSSDLYRIETLKLEEAIRTGLTRDLQRAAADASKQLGALLRDAYLDGLRDGFAQGVVAGRHGRDVTPTHGAEDAQ